MKRLAGLACALLLVAACAPVEEPAQRSTPEPEPPEMPSFEPQPEQTVQSGPVPGSVEDCSSGLWVFGVDYTAPSGQVYQGDNVSAYCEREIEMRAFDGSLFIDNRGVTVDPGSVVMFTIPLSALDRDARECQDLYGYDCT